MSFKFVFLNPLEQDYVSQSSSQSSSLHIIVIVLQGAGNILFLASGSVFPVLLEAATV
jgi:hypothetical protein